MTKLIHDSMRSVNLNTHPEAATGWRAVVWEYAQAIAVALVLALFIRTFVVQAFKIPSGSMIHTLLVGDHILVNKLAYGIRNPFTRALWVKTTEPHRGDVAVFIFPLDRSKDFIKRIIGLPGDTVEVREKVVYVNGRPFPDPPGVQHTDPRVLPAELSPRDNMGPVTVPPGSVFVMGDNRDQSYDSRFWGFVPIRDLKGKAMVIYWSWDSERLRPRLGRIGRLVH